jgi:hypothetical protein
MTPLLLSGSHGKRSWLAFDLFWWWIDPHQLRLTPAPD